MNSPQMLSTAALSVGNFARLIVVMAVLND
jgi:hypothetical protein